MATVELRNVGKVYEGGVRAVDNANITVNDREFVVLVGPSGCGKTTTLRMVAGLEDITEGELYIDGNLVNDIPPKDRDIAMVFQNYALYPHMTVYDNKAAQILEIEELLDRKPKALSGGQRQRVALGRAIVRKPKVFLFDEPLSNLDAKLRVQMRAEISALHTRLQATMIYVTHDQVEAMTMADKIVVMKSGIIQQIGSPLDLYNNPANRFVAGFLGSPSMNFLTAKLREEAGKVIADEGDSQIELLPQQAAALKSYVGREIVVGIRPEDFIYNEKGGKGIRTHVEIIEPLGAEIHVYVSTKKHQMISRVAPTVHFKVGDEAVFNPMMDRVKFFDLETEQAIPA